MNKLSHLDKRGRAHMVDVSGKGLQRRIACASGKVIMAKRTLLLIEENLNKKGDVLTVAQLAGIQGAKNTAHLIPLCHPLILEYIDISFNFIPQGIEAKSEVVSIGRTGVEMEALTAVSIALLTIYDMCKAVDKKMLIADIVLLKKIKSAVT